MSATAWRIVKRKWAATAFTGEGARLNGGRWSPPGLPVVYLASSAALAKLEMLVHLRRHELLQRYSLFPVEFDPHLVTVLAKPPKGWRDPPPQPLVNAIGVAWATAGKSPLLQVPSVLSETDHNYLFNPLHPDAAAVRIGKQRATRFDPRLKD